MRLLLQMYFCTVQSLHLKRLRNTEMWLALNLAKHTRLYIEISSITHQFVIYRSTERSLVNGLLRMQAQQAYGSRAGCALTRFAC